MKIDVRITLAVRKLTLSICNAKNTNANDDHQIESGGSDNRTLIWLIFEITCRFYRICDTDVKAGLQARVIFNKKEPNNAFEVIQVWRAVLIEVRKALLWNSEKLPCVNKSMESLQKFPLKFYVTSILTSDSKLHSKMASDKGEKDTFSQF